MQEQKQQLIDKIQESTNILVTVSSDPSVDQLAACIGLTLLLNKLDKHATAVFSGTIPSTLEFLKPEETIERNTNSLRDFIIALDKSKADKLRYKVEDKIVKIFITPYRTSLTSDDLEFSQGDFNVDMVIALGVHQQSDLDTAITAHGRILHDAVVTCINNTPNGEMGQINWQLEDASSLSELVAELAKSFDKQVLDQQISTALLTGIVAETDRFKNEKTTAVTMSLSSDLMAAGANQQLVADQLDNALDVQGESRKPALDAPQSDTQDNAKQDEPAKEEPPKTDDGTLEINHEETENKDSEVELPTPEIKEENADNQNTKNDSGHTLLPSSPDDANNEAGRMMTDAPTLGGTLTANSRPEHEQPSGVLDPISAANKQSSNPSALLDREEDAAPGNVVLKQPDMRKQKVITPLDSASTDKIDAQASKPDMPPQPAPEPPPMPFTMPTPAMSATPPPMAPAPAISTSDKHDMPPKTPAWTPPVSPTPVMRPEMPTSMSQPTSPPPNTPGVLSSPSQPSPAAETPAANEPAQPVVTTDADIDAAREAVMKALSEEQADVPLPPTQSLNAMPIDLGKHDAAPAPGVAPTPPTPAVDAPVNPLPPNAPDLAPLPNSPADQPLTMPIPTGISVPPPQSAPPTNAQNPAPNSPPPVPPPMMPPPSQ